jgi:hypothetical protein
VTFRDAEEARIHDEHRDDLTVAVVLERLLGDLRARGEDVPDPTDPLHDPSFVAALTRVHQRAPTVYPWGRAATA